MEGVNPFIKNNKHRMIMFLDELGVGYLFPFLLRHRWKSLATCRQTCGSSVPMSRSDVNMRVLHRMSLTSLKLQSTLGQTCPVTLQPCMRSVSHTQTTSAP